MQHLVEGVSRFQREIFPKERELFQRLSTGQHPDTLFITCADSRVVPTLITQTKPGDLFICRNAGNMVPGYGEVHGGVSATIEYAVAALNVKHIIICGHTDCGAVKALLHPEKVENLPTVKSWLAHGEAARRVVLDNFDGRSLPENVLMKLLIEQNVVSQLAHLRTHPAVASRLARRTLQIHGWVYNIERGSVDIWDARRAEFVSAEQYRFDEQPAADQLDTVVRPPITPLQQVAP